MIDLPESAHALLSLLPPATGMLWGKTSSGLPIFVLRDGRLASSHPTYAPLRVHTFQPQGTLLEFQLRNGNAPPITLLLNPAHAQQQDLMGDLAQVRSIELWECDPQARHCLATQLIHWPESYRQQLRVYQRQSFPAVDWPTLLARWMQATRPAHNAPAPHGNPTPGTHNIPIPKKPAVPAGQRLVQIMEQAAPFSLFWRPGKEGIPECLVKLPPGPSPRISLAFGPLVVKSYRPEGDLLVLPFTITAGKKKKRAVSLHSVSLFNPTSPVDTKVLSQLATASEMLVLGYPSGSPQQPPSRQRMQGLSKAARGQMASLLGRRYHPSAQWEATKQRFLREEEEKKVQYQREQEERKLLRRYPLPTNWKETFTLPTKMVLLPTAAPLILIKGQPGERLQQAWITFRTWEGNGATTAPRVHLHATFKTPSKRMEERHFSYPLDTLSPASRLYSSPSVPILIVEEAPELTLVQAQEVAWPYREMQRYYQTHQSSTDRSEPGLSRTTPPPAIQRVPAPLGEKTLPLSGEGAISRAGSVAPEGQRTGLAGDTRVTTEHLPLFERCVLRQQATTAPLVTPGWPLDRGLFWRLHIIPALELAERYRIDTNALSLIEKHRSAFTQRSSAQLQSTDKLPRPHLWFELQHPLTTPICLDAAALLVCSLDDQGLSQRMRVQWQHRSAIMRELENRGAMPEQAYQVLCVFNRDGDLVWSMAFSRSVSVRPTHWLPPLWDTCPSHRCPALGRAASSSYTPCAQCERARVFFTSWFQTVRFAMAGAYQERYDQEEPEGPSGRRIYGAGQPSGEAQARGSIVRSIDISEHVRRAYEGDPLHPRGSWLEEHLQADPTSVAYEPRDIAEHVRILRAPRYRKYREEHGTNEVIVRAHERHNPRLAHVRRVTRLTARRTHREP